MKATHSGVCQVCGRQQAVRPTTGKLAAHGYTKDLGFFHGTCYGAAMLPLENDATILDRTVENLTSEANIALTRTAADIKQVQATYGRGRYVGRTYTRDYLTLTEENLAEQKAANSASEWWAFRDWASIAGSAVREMHGVARAKLAHVEMLKHLRASRFGQPLTPRG